MGRNTRFSLEVRERALRMVFDHRDECNSQWEATRSIAEKIGCSAGKPRKWVRQTEVDTGRRGALTITERDRIKELEHENRELRRTNDILRARRPRFSPSLAIYFCDPHSPGQRGTNEITDRSSRTGMLRFERRGQAFETTLREIGVRTVPDLSEDPVDACVSVLRQVLQDTAAPVWIWQRCSTPSRPKTLRIAVAT